MRALLSWPKIHYAPSVNLAHLSASLVSSLNQRTGDIIVTRRCIVLRVNYCVSRANSLVTFLRE